MLAHRTAPAAGVAALASLALACAAPSLEGFEPSELAPLDQRLIGEWRDPGDAGSPTFVVTAAKANDRTYAVVVRGHPDTGEQLAMTAGAVLVGEHLILDLSLAREELEPIGDKYGLLLMPTHVFYRIDFEDDALRIHQLDFGWLADFPGLTMVDEVPVFTGGSDQLLRVFDIALRDPVAWVEVGGLQRAP